MAKRHLQSVLTTATLTAVSLFGVGCKPDPAVKDPAIVGRGRREPVPPPSTQPHQDDGEAPVVTKPSGPASGGSISGTVFFRGKAPAMTIDTSMDPACALGSARSTLPTEQFVVANGRLANVFLYIRSGPAEAMSAAAPSPQPVVLDQRHCQYTPHVIGVTQGGVVEFRNSDPTMHNVHTNPTDVGNETIDISEGPRGRSQVKQFRKAELMIPVRCNNHPWMNAFINVSPTPFFAVSDANGQFNLRGLPPGNYVLGAVHEKMGEKTMQLTIAANGAAKVDFTFVQ